MPPGPREPELPRILRWTLWSVAGGGAAALLTALWVMSGSDAAVREAYRRDLPAFLLIWGALLSAVAAAYLLLRHRTY